MTKERKNVLESVKQNISRMDRVGKEKFLSWIEFMQWMQAATAEKN